MIRVGGVPEHFNLPWHLALESGQFLAAGVRVEWVELKLGTGQMIGALKAGDVDLVVALTEGLVADIALGSSIRLVGTYVESPLTWAISTGPTSNIHEVADLKGARIGISRFTSGSHLMSCVLASQRGWNSQAQPAATTTAAAAAAPSSSTAAPAPAKSSSGELSFVVEGSFENLRASVVALRTDAFMWEHYTTKPYHDKGEVRRVGEIVTPWPCFLLASRDDILAEKRPAIERVLRVIQASCRAFKSPAAGQTMVPEIARRYGLREEDAAAWYRGVNITAAQTISEATLEQTVQALKDAGILTAQNYPVDKPLQAFVDSSVTLEADIRSMKLYSKPELLTALYNNVRVRIGKEKGPLDYKELLPYGACEKGNKPAARSSASGSGREV